jgi:hypothetical protein
LYVFVPDEGGREGIRGKREGEAKEKEMMY